MQALQNLDDIGGAGLEKSLDFANDIVKTMQQQKIVLLTIFTAVLAIVLEGMVSYLWVDMAVESIRCLPLALLLVHRLVRRTPLEQLLQTHSYRTNAILNKTLQVASLNQEMLRKSGPKPAARKTE